MTKTTKQAAIEYLKMGLKPIPVHYAKAGGCSCKAGAECDKIGKHPLPKGWTNPDSERYIKEWDNRYNIGIVAGTPSGVLYLDIDTHNAESNGFNTLAALEEKHGKLPETLTQRTGGGGEGRLFRVEVELPKLPKNSAGLLGAGLDIRTTGGQFVAPPSTHKSGKKYEWLNWGCPIAAAPEWFINLCIKTFEKKPSLPAKPEAGGSENLTHERYALAALEAACIAISTAKQGTKNETLNNEAFSVAGLIGAGILDRSKAESHLRQAARDTGYTSDSEIDGILNSAITKGMEKPRDLNDIGKKPSATIAATQSGEMSLAELAAIYNPARDTDGGNADRLLAKARHLIRFTRESGWMIWNGKKWVADDTAVKDLAKTAILEKIAEQVQDSVKAVKPDLTKALAGWWKRSDNDVKVLGALSMSEGTRGVYVKKADFDKDPMVFNAANGIIDLRSGVLIAHEPSAMLTRLSPVVYDPAADCPTFKKFMLRVMGGSADLVSFMQKAIGYTLTGAVKEQCWFFLYGRGQNGKSTLIDIIAKMLGEYTGKTGIETFIPKHNQQAGNTPEIAALDGARFVYASETEEGKALAAGRIKDMTGGEAVTAMPKYRDPYSFYPVWKIWISGNHKPTIRDTTISTWRRIRMIPFSVQIPEAERDSDLPAKLEAELPGILKWSVDGCLAWQREGLKPCKEIMAATAEYQNSQDILAAFLAACCYLPVKNPWSVKTTSANLYEAYKTWCENSGEKVKSQRVFGEALAERGFISGRVGTGAYAWEGIGLLTSEPSEPSEPYSGKVYRKKCIGTLAEVGSEGSEGSDNEDDEGEV